MRSSDHDNLTYCGSALTNATDKVERGRQVRGEDHASSRLTWAQVDEIRERHGQGGITQTALSQEYGVSQVMIGRIVRRANWKSR